MGDVGEELPLKFWMPGEWVGYGHKHLIVSVYYTGRNFTGLLKTVQGNVNDGVWSLWTVNVHGALNEVKQGSRDNVHAEFVRRMVLLANASA